MARLEDKGARGLPPAPAPVRRGANPWKLSDTARKREEPRPASIRDLLDEIHTQAAETHAGEAAGQAPEPVSYSEPSPQPARRSSGPWPLFVLLLAIGFIIKIASTVTRDGDWRMAIGPIIVLLFIAQAWWRMRERRQRKAERHPDERH